MEEKNIRNIFYYKSYYLDFFNALDPEVKKKFNWTLKLISSIERVPVKYFKHIEDTTGIYEVRVEFGSNIYRVFSFFDKGQLVVLINGFHKKTGKTPMKEIDKAEKLKKQYYDEKSAE